MSWRAAPCAGCLGSICQSCRIWCGSSTQVLGKPALAIANPVLKFNLAHSGDLALLALAATREVGVGGDPVV